MQDFVERYLHKCEATCSDLDPMVKLHKPESNYALELNQGHKSLTKIESKPNENISTTKVN